MRCAQVVAVRRSGSNECGCDAVHRVRRADVHVAGHHRGGDDAVPSIATPARQSLRPLWLPKPTRRSRRRVGGEPLRRHPAYVGRVRDLLRAVGNACEFLVGERRLDHIHPCVPARPDKRVAVLLVRDVAAGDLLRGHDVLAHVLDDLVLELVVGHAHDLQVEVEVRRLDVDERPDRVRGHDVLPGQRAELAAVPAQVARPLELHLAEPDPCQAVEVDRLEVREHCVEVRRVLLRLQERAHDRAAGVVERGAAAVHRPPDHLHAEPLARGEVQRRVDVVEPSDVEVRLPPHRRHQHRPGLEDVLDHDRHPGGVLERIHRAAVDEPPRLTHVWPP